MHLSKQWKAAQERAGGQLSPPVCTKIPSPFPRDWKGWRSAGNGWQVRTKIIFPTGSAPTWWPSGISLLSNHHQDLHNQGQEPWDSVWDLVWDFHMPWGTPPPKKKAGIKSEKVKQNKTEECLKWNNKEKSLKNQLMKQINNLPEEVFKTLVIEMLTELGKRMDKHWEF